MNYFVLVGVGNLSSEVERNPKRSIPPKTICSENLFRFRFGNSCQRASDRDQIVAADRFLSHTFSTDKIRIFIFFRSKKSKFLHRRVVPMLEADAVPTSVQLCVFNKLVPPNWIGFGSFRHRELQRIATSLCDEDPIQQTLGLLRPACCGRIIIVETHQDNY